MACPRCGGSERATIAPGYYECLTERIEGHYERVPLDGVAAPIPTGHLVVCGHRYHESGGAMATLAKCACGTYAIGECAECGQSVCGDCSGRYDGQRICHRHAHERAVVREQEQQVAAQARAQAFREEVEAATVYLREFPSAAQAAGLEPAELWARDDLKPGHGLRPKWRAKPRGHGWVIGQIERTEGLKGESWKTMYAVALTTTGSWVLVGPGSSRRAIIDGGANFRNDFFVVKTAANAAKVLGQVTGAS